MVHVASHTLALHQYRQHEASGRVWHVILTRRCFMSLFFHRSHCMLCATDFRRRRRAEEDGDQLRQSHREEYGTSE